MCPQLSSSSLSYLLSRFHCPFQSALSVKFLFLFLDYCPQVSFFAIYMLSKVSENHFFSLSVKSAFCWLCQFHVLKDFFSQSHNLKDFFVSSVSSMCLICQLNFSPQVSALSCRCYGFIACRFHKSKVLQMFVSKMDTICKLYCAWTVVVMIYFVWVRSYCLCKDE